MKYYQHKKYGIVYRVAEGYYEFASWGNPHWYREEGSPFNDYFRETCEEISKEDAEAYLAAALQEERRNLKQRRPDDEVVTVCIAERGLKPYTHNWYIREEVEDEEEYFEPNLTWFEYRVLRQDVDHLIALYSERLSCDWTPNQSWEERELNAARREEILAEIEELESRAKEVA